MKIAIPVNDKKIHSRVCQSFGRTPYFLIYDSISKKSVFIKNNAETSQGGAGIKAAQLVVDLGVSALLTPRCGENAAKVMKVTNIQIYKTIHDSVEKNMIDFNEGRLSLIEYFHEGFHGNEEQ